MKFFHYRRPSFFVTIVFILSVIFATLLYQSKTNDWSSITGSHGRTIFHSEMRNQRLMHACSNSTARNIWDPYRAIEVRKSGTILERVGQFNCELESVRTRYFLLRGGKDRAWTFKPSVASSSGGTRKVVDGMDDFFLSQLSNFTGVTMLVLPWETDRVEKFSTADANAENLLVSDYYPWSASEPLCSWIASKVPINNMKYDIVYRNDCNTNLSTEIIERPRSLPRVFLNAIAANRVRLYEKPGNSRTSESDFYEKSPPLTLFCHVLNDVIVTENGDVFSYNFKYMPYGCPHDSSADSPKDSFEKVVYDEVFVITQYWGTAIFHKMIEIMPRIALYLDFLSRNPQVRILAPEGPGTRLAELVQILGLDPNRLVTGVVRAKVAYLPRSSMCGTVNIPEVQILSHHYRQYTVRHLLKSASTQELTFHPEQVNTNVQTSSHAAHKSNIPSRKNESPLPNRLVLIRRSGHRHFTQQKEIEAVVSRAAADFNLTYEVFSDNPTPSLSETMVLFHSAVMVVGPHGAGLANIVFAQPGTYVIEGVCNTPHINLCFMRTAVVLGHHWHGIPSRQGCEGVVDVDAGIVDAVVRSYLKGRNRS